MISPWLILAVRRSTGVSGWLSDHGCHVMYDKRVMHTAVASAVFNFDESSALTLRFELRLVATFDPQ